jgi:hypothetical protein
LGVDGFAVVVGAWAFFRRSWPCLTRGAGAATLTGSAAAGSATTGFACAISTAGSGALSGVGGAAFWFLPPKSFLLGDGAGATGGVGAGAATTGAMTVSATFAGSGFRETRPVFAAGFETGAAAFGAGAFTVAAAGMAGFGALFFRGVFDVGFVSATGSGTGVVVDSAVLSNFLRGMMSQEKRLRPRRVVPRGYRTGDRAAPRAASRAARRHKRRQRRSIQPVWHNVRRTPSRR